MLVLTTGRGVDAFTLDRGSGEYLLTHRGLTIKPDATDFTVNMANKRYWTPPIQRYIDECIEGAHGQRGVHFNMRWMGSMVADVYRLFHYGGIYPGSDESNEIFEEVANFIREGAQRERKSSIVSPAIASQLKPSRIGPGATMGGPLAIPPDHPWPAGHLGRPQPFRAGHEPGLSGTAGR